MEPQVNDNTPYRFGDFTKKLFYKAVGMTGLDLGGLLMYYAMRTPVDPNFDPHDFTPKGAKLPADWDCFFVGSMENNVEKVTEYLSNNPDQINKVDNEGGLSALHIAVKNKSIQVVELLLEKGIDFNLENKRGITAFHIAAGNGSNEIINKMISMNKVPNGLVCSVDGETALFLSISNTHLEITRSLLNYYKSKCTDDQEYKSIINHSNGHGVSPLILTILRKDVDGARLLLDNGADVNITTSDGNTPLHIVGTFDDESSTQMADILLKSGADVSIENKNGWNALHQAHSNKVSQECYQFIRNFLETQVSNASKNSEFLASFNPDKVKKTN